MESIEVVTPAKVNLSLRVLGRRDDGFHELESLMTPISVFDRIEISHRDEADIEFLCDEANLCPPEENLAVRAARLFCTSYGVEPNLRISLHKEIPHGAGLGGGSSDAAAVILALNALFETDIELPVLASLAAELGSDIPFFIYRSAAMIRGRGEHVEPVSLKEELPLLLIKPPFGVPTPWAYSRWKESRELPGVPYGVQSFAWGELVNDLERPVFEKHVILGALKWWLLEQPEVTGALMSGSGSTMFAVLKDKSLGYTLGDRLAEQFGRNLWAYLCETVGVREIQS